ncbi:carbohydrate kinase family protein [Pseudaminobacter sp. 19-2017]|uniref:Carbohydrate kinase family protein n=1 Tax=Pseudaminobacter soli (ex Zhang et al. 2022) TaxID=2831468 RepID=A0A942E2A7_9HYPH|nr:carbohydrate kinase family protein [Pseudaminobacter soli]MBS3652141.1 carbohydrate kinase family protein [Pseudaminobacter soli]
MNLAPAFFIGDVSLDEYYASERWPGLADKGFVDLLGSYVGGSIANAASVHAGLGSPTEFVSLLNFSPVSDRLIAELEARGVSVRHMLRQEGIAESRNIIFLAEGEHVVLTVDMGFQPMALSGELMRDLRQPGYLYTTLYRSRRLRHGDLEQAALLQDLRAHGRRTVFDLDVGGFGEADLPYLQGASVLILNQVGYAAAFGDCPVESLGGWMEENAVGTVIRTRAANGAEAFDRETRYDVSGYAVSVEDVTGAGDTFGGALVHVLGQGGSMDDALELAVAASARAVTIRGPAGGIASHAAVAAFRASLGRAT